MDSGSGCSDECRRSVGLIGRSLARPVGAVSRSVHSRLVGRSVAGHGGCGLVGRWCFRVGGGLVYGGWRVGGIGGLEWAADSRWP